MSMLDELIQQYCPDGVEYKTIKSCAEVGTGSSDRKDAVENGKYPFYVRSKKIEHKDNYEYDEEAIIIPGEGGIGDIFHYVNGKYALHQRAYRIHIIKANINTMFVKYYMESHFKSFIMMKAVSATVTSIRKPMIEDFEIPVPPLPVQEEIVRILDKFTELEAELEAELEMRKKQYEYYRDEMCSFDKSVPEMLLGELFTFKNGINKEKDCFGHGTPIINFTDVYNKNRLFSKDVLGLVEINDSETERFKVTKGDVFFTRTSETINEVGYSSVIVEDIDNCIFSGFLIKGHPTTELLLPEYCSYCFRTSDFRKNIVGKAHMTTRATITGDILKSIKISVPSLEVQKHIVDVLDKFNSLTRDISEGLPAEIKMRHQQYEYYRDKLLTFERL